ncbi:hypothetical protein CI102_14809 [Trichoderma harzianum]|uniref:Uncharacterized protein n=1 Tax=Trichoderma harzianum CBS 226.95 TaxID=983964 RepID=A0A2T3ZRJ7_TRIHA|nr:hypothetical protein M431DRAFT_488564 [Trichoderma harzianum CBS 226.95]PKK40769.1 hypothetical protein CI102_14809 [Trichoderma harzianum]PTB47444.1 hypothetical protein M431DRAFT_488564 [Trichoderma harzianum CBS 226.95]
MKNSIFTSILVGFLQILQCSSSPVSQRCSDVAAQCMKAATIHPEMCIDAVGPSCLVSGPGERAEDDVSGRQLFKRYEYDQAWVGETFNYGNFVATLQYLQNSGNGELLLSATARNLISTITVSLAKQLIKNYAGKTGGAVTTTINNIQYRFTVTGAGVNVDSITVQQWENTLGPLLEFGVIHGWDILTGRLDIGPGAEWVTQIYRLT